MDNSSYHYSLDIKEFAKKNQLKFLFNVPYKSEFNGIEIIFYIEDENINKDAKKVYKKTYEECIRFYEKYLGKINAISLNKKKPKKKNNVFK